MANKVIHILYIWHVYNIRLLPQYIDAWFRVYFLLKCRLMDHDFLICSLHDSAQMLITWKMWITKHCLIVILRILVVMYFELSRAKYWLLFCKIYLAVGQSKPMYKLLVCGLFRLYVISHCWYMLCVDLCSR